jgi:hypothetical protein
MSDFNSAFQLPCGRFIVVFGGRACPTVSSSWPMRPGRLEWTDICGIVANPRLRHR